jgi:pimeloyl-ACP methyl ester carboxylesterase
VTGSLYVDDAGAGTPVLAVHGLGGSAEFFAALSFHLRPDCRVISVDLPGTGRSGGTPDFSMDSWVADLGALVAERVGEPVIVLGHSLGTMIALHAWRQWPHDIRGLILAGGLPQVRPLIRQRLSERVAALAGAGSLRGWGPRVSPGVFSPTTVRDQPGVVSAFEQRFELQSVESYVRCTRILLDADARGIAPTVTVPTLAVTGADDQYAPPDDVAAFAATIPGATVEVLPACGHLPFLERPREFAGVVLEFVRGC